MHHPFHSILVVGLVDVHRGYGLWILTHAQIHKKGPGAGDFFVSSLIATGSLGCKRSSKLQERLSTSWRFRWPNTQVGPSTRSRLSPRKACLNRARKMIDCGLWSKGPTSFGQKANLLHGAGGICPVWTNCEGEIVCCEPRRVAIFRAESLGRSDDLEQSSWDQDCLWAGQPVNTPMGVWLKPCFQPGATPRRLTRFPFAQSIKPGRTRWELALPWEAVCKRDL